MNKEECGKPPALPLRGGQRPTWRPEREEAPLGCNLGKAVTISPEVPCHPTMSCEIATSAVGLLAMTHQGNALVHQRPPAIEWLCTRRSLSAATPHILAFTVLSLTCTDRQHSAGSGMPLPYNGVCDQRECLPEIATSACGLLAMTNLRRSPFC